MKTSYILGLITLLFIAGCASVGNEMEMADMSKIQKGQTTRSELIQLFGNPYTVGISNSGEPTATWIYSEARNKAKNFIPIVGAFNMQIDTRLQQLVVIFDENDIVKSFTFNESNSPIKSGLLN